MMTDAPLHVPTKIVIRRGAQWGVHRDLRFDAFALIKSRKTYQIPRYFDKINLLPRHFLFWSFRCVCTLSPFETSWFGFA